MDPRIDRLATLHVARPLLQYAEQSIRIPILMYHSVADEDETGVHAYYRTVTSPHVFAREMSYLHDNGYSAIGLGELGSRVERQRDSTKCVVIRFDDGYSDFYVHAFPIL